jgi:Ca-activated chloride channel family protein
MAQNGQAQGAASSLAAHGRGLQRAGEPTQHAAGRPEARLVSAGQQAQSNLRQIGSKTFYFKDNRWIDSTVKPDEDAKAKRIRQFSDEFFALARSQSAELNQYLTFTEPVTLNLSGAVYRIDPADSKP